MVIQFPYMIAYNMLVYYKHTLFFKLTAIFNMPYIIKKVGLGTFDIVILCGYFLMVIQFPFMISYSMLDYYQHTLFLSISAV